MQVVLEVWRSVWTFIGLRIRRAVLWWVKPRVSPQDVMDTLELDAERPVCYVLGSNSLADYVVLENACRRVKLPRPQYAERRLPRRKRPTAMFLPGKHERQVSDMERIIERAIEREKYDVQIVPVSVFWGRDPGKETSLFKIIFSDSPLAGSLRKFFIVLANGRNTFVHYGQPISVTAFVGEDTEAQAATHKLNRVLRVHFRRQRDAVLGPSLYRRNRLIDSLIATPSVQAAIEQRCAESDISRAEAIAEARDYADEIAADFSVSVIRFMEQVVAWIRRRVFDDVRVYHFDRMREQSHDKAVVLTPAHRSHLDYLIMTESVYLNGMAPPHIAAGINMNFGPIGGLLRRAGAFYLRRSFAGNRIYTAVFRSYIDVLLTRGYSMEFFPEGGRSRTGRLLKPKTGMLSMVVQSYLANPGQAVMAVPIYIGYDKVVEVSTYYKELGGKAKKSESTLGMLRGARRAMREKTGGIYVSFGKPLDLGGFVDEQVPNWKAEMAALKDGEQAPWLHSLVKALAEEVMSRINRAAVLSPTGLVAALLLASPQKALAEDELLEQIRQLIQILKAAPYSSDMSIAKEDPRAILEMAERVGRLKRTPHVWGDVLSVEGRQAVLLTYARNTVQHLLVLPALVARQFKNHDEVPQAEVLHMCKQIYPFLREELSLRFDHDELDVALQRALEALVDNGLLIRAGDMLRRPAIASSEFAMLINLGRILRETLERLCMTAVLLANNPPGSPVERKLLEDQCSLLAERITILSGANSPEFFDPALFRSYINTFKDMGFLVEAGQNEEGELLEIDPRLKEAANRSLDLVDPDVLQSILQLIDQSSLKSVSG